MTKDKVKKDRNEWGTPELTAKYLKATPGQGKTPIKQFREFLVIDEADDIDEATLEQLVDEDIANLKWEDIADLYDEEEFEEVEDDLSEEGLTYQGRLKKRFAAIRNKKKRQVAKTIALRRPSSNKVLRKRAVLAARRIAYKKLLRGRKRSSLSPSEKSTVEKRIKIQYVPFIARTATKLRQGIRTLEMTRLKNARSPKAKKQRAKKHPTSRRKR